MKEFLEDLIKSLKVIDKSLLTKTTKFSQKYEEKGHSKKKLLVGLAGLNCLSFLVSVPFQRNYLGYTGLSPLSLPCGIFSGYGVFGPSFSYSPNVIKDGTKIKSNDDKLGSSPIFRLGSFLIGTCFLGKGIYDITSGLIGGNAPEPAQTGFNLSMGTYFFSASLGMYLRNTDPKLLDKAKNPIFKRAYNFVKNKVGEFLPTPFPQPNLIPIKS